MKPTPLTLRRSSIALFFIISACSLSGGRPSAATASPTGGQPSAPTTVPSAAPSLSHTPSVSPSSTPSATATLTPTPLSPSPSPTASPSSTPSATATISPTSGPSLTPTFDFPGVTVAMQANCRYGPGTAYLYSHGLYTGDRGEVHGRNYSASWLWIKPENLDRHCWVSASVVEIEGDPLSVVVVQRQLPQSTLYGPPQEVSASRDGDLVTVTWERVWMTEDDDRGYLIEANLCQDGFLVPVAVHTDDTAYEFTDEEGCSGQSGGLLYTVEKHGYTAPVEIPWP